MPEVVKCHIIAIVTSQLPHGALLRDLCSLSFVLTFHWSVNIFEIFELRTTGKGVVAVYYNLHIFLDLKNLFLYKSYHRITKLSCLYYKINSIQAVESAPLAVSEMKSICW
jgi:hypothetical protein